MTDLVRRFDWRSRLSAAINAAMAEPFQWGTHDCALHAADCVLAMTDVDLAAEWRGTYDTEAGAYGVLRAMGLEDVAGLPVGRLPEIAPALAAMGDVVVVVSGNEPALGVVLGERVSVLRTTGLGHVSLDRAIRAFRV